MNHKKKRGFFREFSLTNLIILVNVVVFIAFYLVTKLWMKNFYFYVAVTPLVVLSGKMIWTAITSIFTHQMLLHLFVNMFSLYFLGNFTERIIGRKRMFWLYIIAGIIGSIFYVLFAQVGTLVPHGDYLFGALSDSAVGASGAIFGLLGLMAMLVPKNRVYLIVGPLIVIILEFVLVVVVPEEYMNIFSTIFSVLLIAMIVAMLVPNEKIRRFSIPIEMPLWVAPIAAIVPLVLISFFVKLPIGNTAHLGGLVVGLIFGWYLKVKYKKKVMLLERYFASGQNW